MIRSFLIHPPRWALMVEFAFIYAGLPLFFYAVPMGFGGHVCLLIIAAYAAWILSHMPDFSWVAAWRGMALTHRDWAVLAARLLFATFAVVILTHYLAPERLLMFPIQKPLFWLLIMLLYPVLSALPQELVFRTFFFKRYHVFFSSDHAKLIAGSLVFGFLHIVFHNLVSPFLSLLAGYFLTASYLRHASLKKVAIEHALYGDMVFTVGLGAYFLLHRI